MPMPFVFQGDLVKQLQDQLAEKTRLIATLESSLAFAEDQAKQAVPSKIQVAKTDPVLIAAMRMPNLTVEATTPINEVPEAVFVSAFPSQRNSKESVNADEESVWGDFGVVLEDVRNDQVVCVDNEDITTVPAVRLLTDWMQSNGFHPTTKASDQLALNQKDSISVEVSAAEHVFWSREIANFLRPNTKAHAVLAKALYPVYRDKHVLDILTGKAKICLRKECDVELLPIQTMMDQIMDAYEGATALKRVVYQEEDHRETEWKSYSWENARSTLVRMVRERQDLQQQKAKLEREVGDLERHLSQSKSDTPIVGVDSDPVLAKKEANSNWQEWNEREWDYFISYRVASDAVLAKELYFRLRIGSSTDFPPTLPNDRVFLDAEKLKDGNNWTEGFATGLKHSKIVILIVSDGSLERMKTANEFQDNVLLEWENAILAAAEGQCALIPIFVGDVINKLYSINLPAKRFNNIDPKQHKCYLSPRDIISRLKSLQGVFLHDSKSLPTIMKKFPAKLAEIDSCWNEKLHKARLSMSGVGVEGDLLRSVYIHDVNSSVQLDAFLEHSQPYFHDRWSQLSFKDCSFSESSSKRLLTTALQSNDALTSLDISNSDLGLCTKNKEASDVTDLIELFGEVANKPDLLRLSITDSAVQHISVFFKMASLPIPIKLDLSGNNLGNGSMRSVPNLNWVSHLTMRRNNLNDDDLSVIAQSLCSSGAIQLLDLSENNIKMEKETTELETLLATSKSLQELILRNNHICLGGAKTIAKGLLKNKNLVRLDLYDSDFGPKGAELLAGTLEKHQTLEYLNLEKSAIQLSGTWAIRLASRNKERFEFIVDDHTLQLPCNNFSGSTHVTVSSTLISATFFQSLVCTNIDSKEN
ncbi:UNVERIFIED_CONTAM: hypothetical protein HDU68_001770 [Siphonaria sp. JEL0065]|nr:hypothetical protein HDU68_001770 [Siphonaria sp. JEL0065]